MPVPDPGGAGRRPPSAASSPPAPARDDVLLSDVSAKDLEAATWLVRETEGLSASEQAALDAWLAADPANRRAHEEAVALWLHLDRLPVADVAALRAAVRSDVPVDGLVDGSVEGSVEGSVGGPVEGPVEGPVGALSTGGRAARVGRRRTVAGLALASVAATAILTGLVFRGGAGAPAFSAAYRTARGEQRDVDLPDGSRLRLDTATRIEVAFYPDRREVRLAGGQVGFAVETDAGRPFDVYAGPLRITVVGTRFSVRDTATGVAEGGVNVAVEEGRVRVRPVDPGSGSAGQGLVELTGGQAVAADASGTFGRVSVLSPATMAPWREGRVSFDNTPLGQALAEFERYGETGLRIRDPAVAALRLNGSFELRQHATFAAALPRVLPVRLVPRGNGVAEIVRSP